MATRRAAQPKPREAISVVHNVGVSTVAGAAGVAAAGVFATAFPPLLPFAPLIGGAVTGILSGIGSASRTAVRNKKGGFLGLLAQVFSFLG